MPKISHTNLKISLKELLLFVIENWKERIILLKIEQLFIIKQLRKLYAACVKKKVCCMIKTAYTNI